MGGTQSLDRNMPINVRQNYWAEEESASSQRSARIRLPAAFSALTATEQLGHNLQLIPSLSRFGHGNFIDLESK